MSVESQIAKLESLLGRIRRNAGKPRTSQETAELAQREGLPVVELDDPAAALPVTLADNEIPPLEAAASGDVAALQAGAEDVAAGDLEELDMMDDEIVELGAVAPVEDLEADLAEPVPESAPRAALAAAAMPEELELEPPVKTPPPESGRQAVSPVAAAPHLGGSAPTPIVEGARQEAALATPEPEELDLTGAGDVDSLLEADLTGGPISKAPPGVPTMEQLGETVELEGADAPAAFLELEQPAPVRLSASPEPDDLELALPGKEFSGGYDADLAPPEDARADLAKHRQEQESRDAELAAPAPAVTFSAPPSGPVSVPVSVAAETVPAVSLGPVVIERPAAAAVAHVHVAEVIPAKPSRSPETFLELLDQSLAL